MYWHEQLRRTRCPMQKAQVALVLQTVEEAFARHACPRQLQPEVLAGWSGWAAEHTRAFHQASSAGEGRNSYLSQMQHNHPVCISRHCHTYGRDATSRRH
jgi:hypothetical protein